MAYRSVVLDIRRQHVNYLECLAERFQIPLCKAFAIVIAQRIQRHGTEPIYPGVPQFKHRAHLTIAQHHLEYIDLLAREAGVPRSDMVRRLLDEALTGDQTI